LVRYFGNLAVGYFLGGHVIFEVRIAYVHLTSWCLELSLLICVQGHYRHYIKAVLSYLILSYLYITKKLGWICASLSTAWRQWWAFFSL